MELWTATLDVTLSSRFCRFIGIPNYQIGVRKSLLFPIKNHLKTGHHHPKIRKFAGFQADDQVHNAVLRACATAGLYKRAIYIINRIIEVPVFAGMQPESSQVSENFKGNIWEHHLYKLWMFRIPCLITGWYIQ